MWGQILEANPSSVKGLPWQSEQIQEQNLPSKISSGNGNRAISASGQFGIFNQRIDCPNFRIIWCSRY